METTLGEWGNEMFSVKQARLVSGLTQKDVADKLGVHRQTYMKWESNSSEMPIGKALQFSKMVNRRVDEIFFEDQSTLSGLISIK